MRFGHTDSQGRALRLWLLVGWFGFAVLPWYAVRGDGLFSLDWIAGYPGDPAVAPGLMQAFLLGKAYLAGIAVALALPLLLRRDPAVVAQAAGLLGLTWLLAQGFLINHRGWTMALPEALFGPVPGQRGLGWGALVTGGACLMLISQAMAARGHCRGDGFATGAIAVVSATVALFVFFPVAIVLSSSLDNAQGQFDPAGFPARFLDDSVWGLGCVTRGVSCGVAWNTLFLGLLVGAGTTILGLAFALMTARSDFPFKGALRLFTVLPIITPPFVIGLAVILLFGRSGLVTTLLWDWFGIPPSRWIYGLPGVLLAQLLAFTPIAYLVLIGVVQGIAPSLEEAAQTLRAKRWTTFRTVTWPLLRPGVANAFLLGFIESMADFGNPLVLGGNFEVLSTKIFFAVVGAAHDQSRAAVLALVLLGFTLATFYAQQRWLGNRIFTTVTGKGDSGLPMPLPARVRRVCYALALPWMALTFAVYILIAIGGFVRSLGRDNSFTLRHYLTGFSVEWREGGLAFTGSAWDSLWTTIEVSLIAAPLTAAIGLLTAYLLTRQYFAGKRTFEFCTMLSFAIPGTVIGVAYILAFNVPPFELTGTGIILVICFVFRNMPVGVRAGIASLSQIDRSLDEASFTLGARTGTTVRRILMPLLRPAIVAAMVYSFVRAMTAVSAVIFLVSAQHNMATAYIVGRVEAGEFGLAIAYSTVLIVIMILAILLIQILVGERRIGRRQAGEIGFQPGG